jgi:type IV secretion system protein TrbL
MNNLNIIDQFLQTFISYIDGGFALWNRSAFLAERVLGNVISSGIKLMVLAVIVGIGSTLFGTFTAAAQGQEPSLAGAMSLVLAAITLFGLGIYGPAIATGLVSGAPQLGSAATTRWRRRRTKSPGADRERSVRAFEGQSRTSDTEGCTPPSRSLQAQSADRHCRGWLRRDIRHRMVGAQGTGLTDRLERRRTVQQWS